MIDGFVAPGFEEVRREFERTFAERGELGAACAAFVGGEKVVDLWGGVRDARSGAAWEEDSVVLVYSTSKGLAAMTLALAHSRGLLDYDERVAHYWPEFAQAGKGHVTVRQLIGHEAGLPIVDEPLNPGILRDFDRLGEAIARQKPLWEPGTRHGYHGVSLGWYEGELLRRVDPEHRSLGRAFAEDIAGPLGLEAYIGLPEDFDRRRLARIERTSLRGLGPRRPDLPPRMALAMANPRSCRRARSPTRGCARRPRWTAATTATSSSPPAARSPRRAPSPARTPRSCAATLGSGCRRRRSSRSPRRRTVPVTAGTTRCSRSRPPSTWASRARTGRSGSGRRSARSATPGRAARSRSPIPTATWRSPT
jgi:CubicO group peptidase (beta-lactamase class C family)